MASVRYSMDLGLANAGGAPSFAAAGSHFLRMDTMTAITAPAIVEIADGKYYFSYDFATAPAGVDSIDWKVTFNGVEDSGVISGVPAPGAFVPGPPVSGYATAGEVVGRALVRCGLATMSPAQIAVYDPFASTDQNAVLMLDLLRSLGNDLAAKIKSGLKKPGSITTAGLATYYPVPSDFLEMVDQTGWNGYTPLLGPVSAQYAAFLKAWTPTGTIQIPFELLGRNFAFPVVPADGLTLTYDYVSKYWVQSVGSVSGDKAFPTVNTDYLLFDDELLLLGLRLRYRETKGLDTTTDLANYKDQLETAKGQANGGQVLSLNGRYDAALHLVDGYNMPTTPWGQP